MKYLHTMIRISDVDASLRFFCEGLGLKETRRKDSEKGRYTLIFLAPPNDKNTKKYFEAVYNLNNSLALKELSMGMSADYEEAVNYQSTYVRIGSLIFGSRS